MKNKTALIAIIFVVILSLVGGGWWLYNSVFNAPNIKENETQSNSDLPSVDASVEVDLKSQSDGKSVILTVKKIPKDTESIEYELSYMTDKGLPKGAMGKIDLKGKTDITKDILLGTCSTGGKCTYDTGVKSVNVVLRFNSASGASQFSKEYPLK